MSNKENIEINSQAYRSLILPAENINHENEFQQIFDFKTNGNIKNVHIYLLTNQSGKAIKGKMFPDEISQSTFNAYLEYLATSIQNKTFAQYDPTCVENDVIPTLSTQSLSNWSKIKEACVKELTNNEQIEKEDYLELKGNLIVIEAEIETDAPDSNATEEKFYFLSRRKTPPAVYSNANYLLRFYLDDNGQFKPEDRNFLVLPSTVDVVIKKENCYIFSEGNFKTIFRFHAEIEKNIQENKNVIEQIPFIDNGAKFYHLLNHGKYVNRSKSAMVKILSSDRFAKINQLRPEVIKDRIQKLEEFEGKLQFDENNKIVINEDSFQTIIGILSNKIHLDILTNEVNGLEASNTSVE